MTTIQSGYFAASFANASMSEANASYVMLTPDVPTDNMPSANTIGRYYDAFPLDAKEHPALRGYLPMRAQFISPKGTFWRLSITGFASQRDAIGRCQLLRSRGGSCFVRNFAGDQPVQYASR